MICGSFIEWFSFVVCSCTVSIRHLIGSFTKFFPPFSSYYILARLHSNNSQLCRQINNSLSSCLSWEIFKLFSVTFFKFQVKTVFSFILIRSVSRQRALIRNPLSPVSFFSPTFLDFIENSSCPVNSGRYRSVSVARVISLLYSQRESRKLTDREESNEIVIIVKV